jgi:hypothetical protein
METMNKNYYFFNYSVEEICNHVLLMVFYLFFVFKPVFIAFALFWNKGKHTSTIKSGLMFS